MRHHSNYFDFITNLQDGTITRLDFGNSLSNNPVAVNLGNLGILTSNIEGIQIKKETGSGKWIGLIAGSNNDYLYRINFGNSLLNIPTAENLGNISYLVESAHTLYTFDENGNWYTIVGNYRTSRMTLLSFGNSLSNTPTATNWGNQGGLSGPVGFYPVEENGNWYMYVANQTDNSISRLEFGNSLTNKPSGVNLGNIGSTLNKPRSIIILRDCSTVYGFVINETTNDIVRITFPNGLTSQPSGVSLGNIASFSFPHHISQLFREGDSLYGLITNVTNNTLSRITFKGCANPPIPPTTAKNPGSIFYNSPGMYNISLVVDEGLPTQSNTCKQITVGVPDVTVNLQSTEICKGSSVNLSAAGAITYSWSPGTGLSVATGNQVTASPSFTTIYTVTGSGGTGCTATKTVEVKVNQLPIISVAPAMPEICRGSSINLLASGATTFSWSPATGITTLSEPSVTASPVKTTNYTITGTDAKGCSGTGHVSLVVNPLPSFMNYTAQCGTGGNTWLIDLQTLGDRIFANKGIITQQNGAFSVTQIPKNNVDTLITEISVTGCRDTLIVYPPYCQADALVIPESFSPNNDGLNDYFEIKGILNYPESELAVYSISGQKVYRAKNYQNNWDGSYPIYNGIIDRRLPSGTYYYVLQLEPGGVVRRGFVYIAY